VSGSVLHAFKAVEVSKEGDLAELVAFLSAALASQ